MAFPKTSLIEQRRARVADLNVRGLSSREIALALAKGDRDGNGRMVNPETNEPYSHKTILADLDVLKAEWRIKRSVAIDEHVDHEYMEIQEVKKLAWAKKDGLLALQALDREMKLLGTAKDKDGTVINIYLGVIMQIISLAESRGDDPQRVFEGVLMRLQRATSK